ncbi:extracellular solute-binding protein [Pontibacillus litoralis]|uniref:ABC transporter n=1 Tax=Pontibacillus litoralis JSM 072002 TaxID=1385512 RepID=A0A0A5G1E4_9BACI|nr:extracellular solute-binding protein [Pontibacillus litoralis]KGX85864.1 ABC transporter [Pontibacillus litoralis JSM 072002]
MKKASYKILTMLLLAVLLLTACTNEKEESSSQEKPEDAPDTWIADRTVKGLIFMSDGDASTEINPEIQAELKERTGITLELEGVTGSSLDALTAGLAAGDLPDFIAYYLNHSGRPEMQVLLKGAREGMFHDLTPLMQDTEIYSKYLQEDYLPADTRDNVMFREEFDGASYFMHMSIPRHGGTVNRKYVSGPYIRKDIVDELGIDPAEINTSEEVRELAETIQAAGFKDANGKPISPIGPTAWGGYDRPYLFNDLYWTGPTDEKFLEDANGDIKHEAQTDYMMKRVNYIRDLFEDELIHPEYFTMEENKAKEGLINQSFGIVNDMHNFIVENNDMKYIPLGPMNSVQGEYKKQLSYKSGYSGWSIPATTENPEEIMQFADFLASREGKLLSTYGIEGRDYTLDEDGNPIVKEEVLELKKNDPAAAKKLGFTGVGSYWSDHLGYTDIDKMEDFGEMEYGARVAGEESQTPQKIAEMWKYDEKIENAEVIDGSTPKTFMYEYDNGDNLNIALEKYQEDLLRAYYADTDEEAKQIMQQSKENLERSGLEDYIKLIKQKEEEGTTIKY